MADAHTNFAYSTVKTAPSPASTGTTLAVQDGDGPKFPPVPFNATIWPTGVQPTSTNAEIVRVTANPDDSFTIVRTQEGSSARTVVVGDQIAANITKKTLTDAEATPTYYSPFMLASTASGLQTLASNFTNITGTNSIFVFPFTVPQGLKFNEILLANSLSFVTSAIAAASNSYYSHFGIYTVNASSLSLMSSSSFSIAETINSDSVTWSFPVSTATSGWLYSTTGWSSTSQILPNVQSTRLIGLQFGNSVTLSGGAYWMGILTLKSTGNSRSTYGLSHAGLIGQPIIGINQVGTGVALLPIGSAQSNFSGASVSAMTNWWGRYIVGFVTSGGTGGLLNAIDFSSLGATAANLTATILPVMTFVST